MKLKINNNMNLNLSYNYSKKRTLKKKNIYNKTMIIPTHLLQNETSKELKLKNNDISILSNANLNIIRILKTYANEDIIKESSYFNFNNDNQKERSSESKKYASSFKGSPIYNYKKNNFKIKSNKTNNILNSNISNFSSDSITTEIMNNNIKTPNSNKEINKSIFSPHIAKYKENISVDKNLDKSPHRQKFSWRARHYSNPKSPNMKLRRKEKKLTVQEKSKPLANQKIQFRHRNSCFVSNNYFKNHNLLLSPNHRMKIKNNYIGLLNQLEIMKINENIQNDINFIELKKRFLNLKT